MSPICGCSNSYTMFADLDKINGPRENVTTVKIGVGGGGEKEGGGLTAIGRWNKAEQWKQVAHLSFNQFQRFA